MGSTPEDVVFRSHEVERTVVIEESVFVRLTFLRILIHEFLVCGFQLPRGFASARMFTDSLRIGKPRTSRFPLAEELLLCAECFQYVIVIGIQRRRRNDRAREADELIEFAIDIRVVELITRVLL